MERQFIINLDVPEGVLDIKIGQYIKEAISSWGGGFHPEDPLFPANWNNDSVEVTFSVKQSVVNKEDNPIFMPFKDLPIGARFKYRDGNDVWVAIEMYGNGLVAQWNGSTVNRHHQSICCFVDEEWSLESKVEVIG